MTTPDPPADPLLQRASRLFEFLTKVQQLTNRPVRHVDTYGERGGAVVWFHQLPNNDAVSAATHGADPEPGEPVLTLDRTPRQDPPIPGEDLTPWIVGGVDDPDTEPQLKDRAVLPPDSEAARNGDADLPATVLRLEEHPDIQDEFLAWLEDWEAWAAHERAARPVRDLYNEVFRAHLNHENAPEEWEAVIGIGALAWQPEQHDPVLRHCLTFPVAFDFDDETGRLTVKAAEDGSLSVELDMLDLRLWPDQPRVAELKEAAANFAGHALHRDDAGNLARRLTHNLAPDSAYLEHDLPGEPGESLICAFAPALILRKRTQQGLIDVFQTIKSQLEERGEVPAGLRILLDPDLVPEVTEVADPTTGAWIEDGEDIYLPLPVNDRQLDVIRRVDRSAMTLVQGPPGTGKTHTAAALISHLLAQGKRVLVTAQSDQALKEVRGKLPETIRDLSVSVVGAGREELADLKVAVRTLSQAASEYSPEEAQERTERALATIDNLKKRKAQTAQQLLEARESEALHVSHAGYEGTLAQIAAQHVDQADRLGWVADIMEVEAEAVAPLPNAEALELLALLRDRQLHADETEAAQDLTDIEQLPDPDSYADQLDHEGQAAGRAAVQARARDHEAYEAVASLEPEVRRALRQRIDQLAIRADELARRNEQWLSEALADVRSGKLQAWQSRHDQVTALTDQAGPLVERLGPLVDVKLATSNPKPLLPHATAVRAHLVGGKSLKLDPTTHKPKQGMFTAKVIKDAEALFDKVRVDGVPPTTIEALDTFSTWVQTIGVLDALYRAWPATITIPDEDSLAERLSWHEAELKVLTDVIALGRDLSVEEGRLSELGIPKPDWNDLDGVRHFASLVDAADAAEAHQAARGPVEELQSLLADAARWPDAAPVVHQLHLAVRQRDATQYRAGHQRLQRLHEVRELVERRDHLMGMLASSGGTLARQLADDPADVRWDDRLSVLGESWRWAAAATWIRQRSNVDTNALQAAYNVVEDEIRAEAAELAAVRAWSKAVHRLGQQQRADLMQYAQLVQAFGRTGGKYANERRIEMREAMQRCRPSVPVWIMPLYRISQALAVDADLFDVIVVDEASQAGLEATFLQYLAPKIVVIGDDKQISPRAVGVDQQQLRDLASQYLYDDRYKASWQDPKRSLFDEARMRFGDLITLTEHRRCVPDIIGFSNRIAYEPDGIRLLPVRQTGRNALRPIKPVFVEDGYIRGSSNKINPAEVDAIVAQIEKCLADEGYDGLTFGVISLTGAHQAKAIEKALMDRVDPREWQARHLRCGTAPDFQGSERHVMFLSMVAALDGDGRFAHRALTADMYVQQFNVAASRAQDQMWVFHSVRPEELTNREDMRYQLLDYCYSVSRRRDEIGEGHSTSPVPEDWLVAPFDSLFEQRVHNRIFDRGHTVIPQYEVGPYSIDLVVVGAHGKLAVECDGDHWHGPDRYEADMARQRALQRSGWQFFRLRESEFIIDPTAALGPLWEMLDELDSATSEVMVEPRAAAPLAPAEDTAVSTEQNEPITVVPLEAPAHPSLIHESAAPERLVSEPSSAQRSAPTDPVASIDTAAPVMSQPHESPPAEAIPVPNEPENASDTSTVEDGPLSDLAAIYATPATYQHWDTSTPLHDASTASKQQLRDGLMQIVAVEGPILGSRLYQLYVKSTGGSKVGPGIRRTLNSTVHRMVQKGDLTADDPLGDGGQMPKTYRLPDQPPIVVRKLGDRTIHDVPPLELAARLRALRQPDDRQDDAFRRLLHAYGLTRLSAVTRKTLERAASLLDDGDT
ncbi:MAG: AAA domain-containing protein [Actinomycetota bacterium]|nr:AAA domain-containing protein [Actinomycetota bacterium]